MSFVYYKFKAAKDYDTCTFDGPSISVFDLKKEIMVQKKLGKGTDFDLAIYNAQTNDEYSDDMYMIPRNSSILVSRNPAARPGKGSAQRYVNGVMPSAAQGSGVRGLRGMPQPAQLPKHTTLTATAPKPTLSAPAPVVDVESMTEEERIQHMLQQQDEQWQQTQEIMATPYQDSMAVVAATVVGIKAADLGTTVLQMGRVVKGAGLDMKEEKGLNGGEIPTALLHLATSVIGHFINQCPTIGNKDFDRPKLKRTTGIPKIFLQKVDDKSAAGGGVMVTQSGELVQAMPNEQAWTKLTAHARNYLGAGDAYEMAPVPDELACGICHKLLRDAVQIPCCGKNYCDECIRHSLLEHENNDLRFKCPNCNSDQTPDNLVPNNDLRQAVEKHLREFAASRAKAMEGAGSGSEGEGGIVGDVGTPEATAVGTPPPAATVPPAGATTNAGAAMTAITKPFTGISRPPTTTKPFTVISRPPTTSLPFKVVGAGGSHSTIVGGGAGSALSKSSAAIDLTSGAATGENGAVADTQVNGNAAGGAQAQADAATPTPAAVKKVNGIITKRPVESVMTKRPVESVITKRSADSVITKRDGNAKRGGEEEGVGAGPHGVGLIPGHGGMDDGFGMEDAEMMDAHSHPDHFPPHMPFLPPHPHARFPEGPGPIPPHMHHPRAFPYPPPDFDPHWGQRGPMMPPPQRPFWDPYGPPPPMYGARRGPPDYYGPPYGGPPGRGGYEGGGRGGYAGGKREREDGGGRWEEGREGKVRRLE
ncbi:E3 ubiquitin-protein ligase rbbp6 [Rhizophlyctis rosea]|nr:E3 ubiquitin-protein ligase rbbp6 [Rhizophlyctis rosea]